MQKNNFCYFCTCNDAEIADLMPDIKASAVLMWASSHSDPESRMGTPPTWPPLLRPLLLPELFSVLKLPGVLFWLDLVIKYQITYQNDSCYNLLRKILL